MKSNQLVAVGGIALVLCLGLGQLSAQDNPPAGGDRQGRGGRGGGNFDPAEFQRMRLERAHEDLEIKDDTEWKAVEPLVAKVMDAQREAFSGMGRGMFGRGRGGRGGGDNPPADQGGQRRGGPGGFGTPSAEAEALQKAIDSKAPNAEVKAALAKYVASRKAKQAALESAQAELRKVLTPRQEAIASLNGWL